MLQIVGLIVAAYALCRLAQVPFEMSGAKEEWLGAPLMVRWIIVATVSGLGILAIAALTLMLLASGVDLPK